MSRRHRQVRRDHTDPRKPGGDIAGPGGPHDRDQVVIDATDGVLLDSIDVAHVRMEKDGILSGRINKTTDHSRVLYLMDRQGAASLVADVIALYGRAGQHVAFAADLHAAMDRLAADGAL